MRGTPGHRAHSRAQGQALHKLPHMLLRRGFLARRVPLLARALCDRPLAAHVSDRIGRVRALESKLDQFEKQDLVDVVLGLVKNQELSVEQVQARLPAVFAGVALADFPSATGELRFELGRTVECRLGPDEWARGKVVGHYYRESDWPEGQKAPYQVLLEGDDLTARTVYAPSDSEDVIRAAVRFPVGSAVMCCVGVDQWVHGEVVAHYHREDDWPAQLLAPYRVRLVIDAGANGSTATEESGADGITETNEVFIWAPLDSDECIRAAAVDDRSTIDTTRAGARLAS